MQQNFPLEKNLTLNGIVKNKSCRLEDIPNYILRCSILFGMEQNSYPMREWHVKHMENTLIKFVKGLAEDASRWEKRLNKKYGKIGGVSKRIEYDIRHSVVLQVSKVCHFCNY